MNANRFWRCMGLGVVTALVVSGCGTDAGVTDGDPRVDVPGAPGGGDGSVTTPDGDLEELGLWRGHWNGKSLSFTPIDQTAKSAGIRPQGFVNVPDAKLVVTTDEAVVLNSACPQWEDPDVGYFVNGPVTLSNGDDCPDHHLCAIVSLANQSPRFVKRTYVQVLNITPGFRADNSVAVPAGYPLDDSMGLWEYGNLPANGGGGGNRTWNFSLPSCDDFDFDVKVMGVLDRTSYASAATDAVAPSEWIDACTLPGATRVLQNAEPGSVTPTFDFPFPFTLYSQTFNPTKMRISANGALGATIAAGDNASLLTGGGSNYMIYPFWDRLQLGPEGVCYGVTGATPSRKFVATWKNADIVGTPNQENMTFSAILHETSDLIQFVYNRWSDEQADCSAFEDANLGASATIGARGPSGHVTQYSFNTPVFDLHDEDCPGSMYKVTLTPSPGNAF